jgi:hypothetical protein
MHASRNAPRASGVCPKQGLSLSSQTSRRMGAEEPWGAVGAPGHAASVEQDAILMVPARRGGRQAAGEAGSAMLDRWCPHSPTRWEGFLHLDGVALGADLVRGVNLLVLLAVDNCRVHEGAGGLAEGSLLRGSGGHIAVFPKVRWSGACALSAGGVQTEYVRRVGAMGGCGRFPLTHLWLACQCRGVGMLRGSDDASSIDDVSTAATRL